MGIPAPPTLCTTHSGLLLPVKAFILCVHYIISPDGAFVKEKEKMSVGNFVIFCAIEWGGFGYF